MTAKTTFRAVILFEDEVRTAAKLLHALESMPDNVPNDEYISAVRVALSAAFVALQGADDDGATVLLGRKPHERTR